MSRFRKTIVACALFALAGVVGAQVDTKYPGVGRAATPKEVAAWDIDVRPDFKGLPAGSGTVAKGQDVWEAKCALCHGIFGESGEVFSPLVGGVTQEDIKTGRVANLRNSNYPGRTTFMKVPTLSTIWDYINRAMPWTSPKSLTTEEVYSVVAFLLNLNGIVADDFTLSDKNIRDVQARMPNRNGMTTKHSMWPGDEFGGTKKADTSNVACMKDCAAEPKLASFLPDFARNAHGNLAEQNRGVGAQHGADTTRPEAKLGAPLTVAPAAAPKADAPTAAGKAALALLNKNGCTVCHGIDKKIVGPAYTDVAKKYVGQADYLVGKIKLGGSGIWGPIPMPPQTLSEAEAKTIAAWLASGAGK
ncbi:MAG: c-type cytochrome [Rhodoferax sp.]|uniref:c-type cytochrome n=1 Tax=Rhodoferax sp. TaxID=50421 RepID=UPI00301AF2CF